MRIRFFLLLVLFLALFGSGPTLSVYAQAEFPTKGVGMLSTETLSSEVKQASWRAVRGPDAKRGDADMAKVGMELAVLYYQHRAEGEEGIRALRDEARTRQKETGEDTRGQSRIRSPLSSDGRFVTVEAVATDEPARLHEELRRLGLQNGARAGNLVSGQLPISALREAAGLESLRGMLPSYAYTAVGSVGSEADTAHRAVDARDTFGVNGRGQKVCAMSDSYDQDGSASTTASDDIASGDLPGSGNPEGNTTSVDVLDDSFSDSDASDEGRAMLQLIHDIAPGAELGFHTAFGGLSNFTTGIVDLADAGCTVIVDDVGYFVQPFYQDGPVSTAVEEVVDRGVPYFSSAGNDGQNSYEAPFRGSGESGVLADTTEAHDFDSSTLSVDTRQEVTIRTNGSFQVKSMQWTDPSALVQGSAGAETDLDLALVDDTMGVVVESANNSDQDGNGIPFESLEFENDGSIDTDEDGVADSTFHLVIEKAAGPDPDEVKYIYGGEDYRIEEYDTLGPTVFGHPNAEGAAATAAAPFINTAVYNTNLDSAAALEAFSSKGGIDILFDENGNELSTPESRQKPNVTGTDGVSNTFFGFDFNNNGTPNFFGTSAAAPNISAIAGLMLSSRPNLTPSEVYDRLESSSEDVTIRQNRDGGFEPVSEGVDPWSGHGFVRADEAVPEPTGIQIVDILANGSTSPSEEGTVELNWRTVGPEEVDEFVVQQQFFSGSFTEKERVSGTDASEFSSTIRDLPVGEHTFRIKARRNDSTLAVGRTTTTVRRQNADVLAYPNPFDRVVNLSVTLPDEESAEVIRIEVYDALGRRVGVPIESRLVEGAQSISLHRNQLGTTGEGMYFLRVDGETFTETIQVGRIQ